MRQILVDHARAKKAAKRGGSAKRETLSVAHVGVELSTIDILDLHEALEELSKLSARQAQVAGLRFFGGLQLREIAEVLSIAESTVKDHWDVAKVWWGRGHVGQRLSLASSPRPELEPTPGCLVSPLR